ncbi:hypothetical protein [Lutibaculum baratangense]|uniref:Uncharacterized protein n=1 Tax=Lutibaculum baratangense AMV1 TaxID=631454 RepID=V4RNW0_9HYPH|nr:hypothetical protein [Lutibaculum baratangense]ESR26934.1 hypothetical protein N177_0718 [Lutibaculum baratangense AMV1]
MSTVVYGYVICSPSTPLSACTHTFGRTMREAWSRHIGNNGLEPWLDQATIIEQKTQEGWRPMPASLTITSQPGEEDLGERG